jgi:lipoate-protein ligase A
MTSTISIARYERDEAFSAGVRDAAIPRARVERPGRVEVVLGSGSDPARELRVEACRDDGVAVLRRRGGGCAVVLDPGNVVLDVGLPIEGLGGIRTWFDRISAWLVDELAAIGIAGVEQHGVSDLVLDDRKIAGSCMHRSKGVMHYSVTFLVEGDVDLIERYLRHPPREPEYRRGRRHREFVRRLAEHPGAWTAAALAEALERVADPKRLLARHTSS